MIIRQDHRPRRQAEHHRGQDRRAGGHSGCRRGRGREGQLFRSDAQKLKCEMLKQKLKLYGIIAAIIIVWMGKRVDSRLSFSSS